MVTSLLANLRLRPHWMNALLLFCAYMTFIYLPWDIFFKPLADDQEVWFGLLFTGWAAKIGALLHWFVYGGGLWGFWKMKAWMTLWASLYTLQIAIGMFVWSFRDSSGTGALTGGLVASVFLVLAVALWRSPKFTVEDPTQQAASAHE